MEKIVAIAFYNKISQIVITRPGYTSHDAVSDGADTILKIDTSHDSWEKGFLTDTGSFVGRQEAMEIAQQADQLKDSVSGEYLYSDDLK